MTLRRILRAPTLAWLAALACLFLGLTAARADPPPPLILDPGASVPDLAPALSFARDEGAALADLVARFRDGTLSTDFTATAAPAIPYQPIWAMGRIVNGAPDDGRPPGQWIMASDTHGLVGLDVLLIRAGEMPEQLLAHDARAPFRPEEFSATRLRSAPVELAPGEEALLVLRIVHGPVERADFALETPADHQAATFRDGLTLAGFYAFLIACLVFYTGFNLAMRSDVGLAYALVLTLGLGFIAYLDNLLLRLFYPAHPDWHLDVGLTLLFLVVAAGFGAAALSLRRFSSRRGLVAPLLAAGAVALTGVPLVFVVTPEIMANASYVLLAVMLAAQVAAAFRWDRLAANSSATFRGLTIVAFGGMGLLILLTLARLGTAELPLGWAVKLAYALIAAWVMGGLSISLVDIRRSHETALERELAATRKEAETARELLAAERNYTHARDLADRRRQQLATMSHDLKQPLASLRMSMDAMTRDAPPDTRARLTEAFDYLTDLSDAHLADTRPGAEADTADAPDPVEAYPLSVVLDTVAEMFRDEAAKKGLRLRHVSSAHEIAVPPLAMMRIVSNLVSNAVKYTDTGSVLFGPRRRDGQIVVEVHDTGPGMEAETLAELWGAWRQGEASQGEGLGLAICTELAATHGLDLSALSTPGRGTVFRLALPASPADETRGPTRAEMAGSAP